MSFPRYERYKDSGVEWLGEVPEGWSCSRLKSLIAEPLMYGANEAADDDSEENPRFVRITDITDGGSLRDDTFRSLPRHVALPYLLKDGDILLARSGATVGKAFMYRSNWGECCFAGYLIRARINSNVMHAGYLYVFCQSTGYWNFIDSYQIQSTIQNVSAEKYANLVLPLPPLPEQQAIALFLDRETAKIDGLITEQENLIALLKEKRQAVISHAVTKGLNPDAPMKDSGVEWLGDVPEGWDVKPLKRIVSTPITDGPHETPNFFDEGVPFVSAEAVAQGVIDFSKIRGHISEADNHRYSAKYKPEKSDIFMVKSGATTGVTAIVEERTDFNIWSPLAVIRCGGDSMPRFVLNFMRSKNFLEGITLNWSYGTQQNIGMGVIEKLACPVPSLHEQQAIVDHLDNETAKLDALTSEAQCAIDLLKERRSALISAAVTGKIDIRRIV